MGDWIKVKTIPDSGCVEHITPPGLAAHIDPRPSPMSKRGGHYATANGGNVPNLGEKELETFHGVTGEKEKVSFQVAEVSRPLESISQHCDEGKRAIFGSAGGAIYNMKTGEISPFARVGRLYEIERWIKKPAPHYFQGQGH